MARTKTAIVTGGSQGIGLATARAFLDQGHQVVLASRGQDNLLEAGNALGRHRNLSTSPCNVVDEKQVETLVADTLERYGSIDILVNSAGVSMSGRDPLVETRSADWHRMIDTNLTGTYLMCRTALPYLLQSENGFIFNVLSTGAFAASEGVSLYAASKFGARALTEALIEEHRDSSLRISSVSPGPVNSTIWNHKREPPSQEARAQMLDPDDIAGIFVWMMSLPKNLHIPNITVVPKKPVVF